jgi:hypothetical protein
VAGGDVLEVAGAFRIPVTEAVKRWRFALPDAVAGSAVVAVGK